MTSRSLPCVPRGSPPARIGPTSEFDIRKEYDARNTWALRGALSCAAWLADLCDIEISTARTQIGVARAMRDHPLLDTALAHGDISYSKARRLVPYLDGDNDTELIDIARRIPAGRLGAAIAAWARRNDDEDVIEQRQRDSRFCSCRTSPDGTVTLTAQLTPAAAGAVCAVIDTWVTTHQPVIQPAASAGDRRPDASADPPGDHPSLGQQRADALVYLLTAPADLPAAHTESVRCGRGGGNPGNVAHTGPSGTDPATEPGEPNPVHPTGRPSHPRPPGRESLPKSSSTSPQAATTWSTAPRWETTR